MVGYHDEIGAVGQTACLQPVQQAADRGVDLADGGGVFGGLRAVVMPGVIHLFHVQGDQAWCLRVGLAEPAQHLIDTVRQSHRAVVHPPLAGPHALDGRFAARPGQGRGMHAGFFSAHPDRFATPPTGIGDGLAQMQAEAAQFGFFHAVVDDAVVVRTQPGHDRVVVGEGQRRV